MGDIASFCVPQKNKAQMNKKEWIFLHKSDRYLSENSARRQIRLE